MNSDMTATEFWVRHHETKIQQKIEEMWWKEVEKAMAKKAEKEACRGECNDKLHAPCLAKTIRLTRSVTARGEAMDRHDTFTCTRNKGHVGPHVACGGKRHNIWSWSVGRF